MAQVVKHLPSRLKALNSIPSTALKKKKLDSLTSPIFISETEMIAKTLSILIYSLMDCAFGV
jgi:hypothetical protein